MLLMANSLSAMERCVCALSSPAPGLHSANTRQQSKWEKRDGRRRNLNPPETNARVCYSRAISTSEVMRKSSANSIKDHIMRRNQSVTEILSGFWWTLLLNWVRGAHRLSCVDRERLQARLCRRGQTALVEMSWPSPSPFRSPFQRHSGDFIRFD